MTLDEGDELLFVRKTDGNSDLILATGGGYAVRFTEQNVRCMGRLARGVRGITLDKDDCVVGVAVVEEGKQLLTITEGGFGKRSDFEDFRSMKNRGGHGVVCHHITSETGKLASIAAVSEEDDVMIITDGGTIIRTPVDTIRFCSRTAKGVIVMRLADGSFIQTFARLEAERDIEEEAVQAEANPS